LAGRHGEPLRPASKPAKYYKS